MLKFIWAAIKIIELTAAGFVAGKSLLGNMNIFRPIDSAGEKKTAENNRQYYANNGDDDVDRIFIASNVPIKEISRNQSSDKS